MSSIKLDGITLANTANSKAVLDSGVVFPAEHVIKIKSATFRGIDSNDTEAYVVIGSGDSDALTITTDVPASNTSKFLLMVSIGAVNDSIGGSIAFRLNRNGVFITESGSNANTQSREAASFRLGSDGPDHATGIAFNFLDSPSSNAALTYSVSFQNQNTAVATINKTSNSTNTNDSYGTYTASTLIVIEIA
jgi:hypothetical protein